MAAYTVRLTLPHLPPDEPVFVPERAAGLLARDAQDASRGDQVQRLPLNVPNAQARHDAQQGLPFLRRQWPSA